MVPVFVTAAVFLLGGILSTVAQGALWGAVAGAGLVVGFRLAKIELTPIEQGALFVGAVASAVLATMVLPDLPQDVKPTLPLRFGAAWLPLAVASGWVASNHGARRSAAVNVGVLWVAAGAFAIPAAQAFGVLVPIGSLGPVDEPIFGAGDYAFIGLIVAFLGAAGTFAVIEKLPSLFAGAAAVLLTLFAGAQVGFSVGAFGSALTKLGDLPNNWPPDWNWAVGDTGNVSWITQETLIGFVVVGIAAVAAAGAFYKTARAARLAAATWLGIGVLGFFLWLPAWEFGSATQPSPIVETFRIAIISATIGTTVALPVAFMASKITAPNTLVYLLNKSFMNFIRTIPDLFWAMLFVASLGIGPFGGALALIFFSLAIMAKLLSETIDAVDPGPLEAAKSTGSMHVPAVRTSVLPQVLPNYVAYALYIFEINIRASVVLGLVGAGGIGRVLEAQRSFFRFDRVIAIVAVIFIIVFVIEQVSVALRRRLV
jgi:phosphonate transport system permease protein